MIKPLNRTRHLGVTVIAIFAIIAGIGEMIVGFIGNLLGILSTPLTPSISTVIIGSFYSLGGLSFLTMRKWGLADLRSCPRMASIICASSRVLPSSSSCVDAFLTRKNVTRPLGAYGRSGS